MRKPVLKPHHTRRGLRAGKFLIFVFSFSGAGAGCSASLARRSARKFDILVAAAARVFVSSDFTSVSNAAAFFSRTLAPPMFFVRIISSDRLKEKTGG
jgi:hypothetical protein